MEKIFIVGSGIASLVIGRLFKDSGDYVEIWEKENVGYYGLCSDYFDKKSHLYISRFGPRIYHEKRNQKYLSNFLKRFTKFNNYSHQVLSIYDDGLSYWPPSNKDLELLKLLKVSNKKFKENFIYNYSKKQWGDNYLEITEKIRNRFKLKNKRNNNFFNGEFQGIPIGGYSKMLKNMSKGIKIINNRKIDINVIINKLNKFDYVFCSSSMDEFFKYKFGSLEYMTVDFEFKNIKSDSNILPTAVVNLPNHKTITRVSEYNQFYNNNNKNRILGIEKPRLANKGDLKIYPVLTMRNLNLLNKYKKYSKRFKNLFFIGRLGNYKYFNLNDVVENSMKLYNKLNIK